MLTKSILALLFFVSTNLMAAPKSTYVTTQENYDVFKTQLKNLKPQVLKKGFLKIQLTEDQVEKISNKMHSEKHVCGGGITLEDEATSPAELFATLNNLKLNQTDDSFDKIGIRYKELTTSFLKSLSIDNVMNFISSLGTFPNRYSRSENGQKASNFLKQKALELRQQFSRDDVTVYQVKTKGYNQDSVVIKIEGKDPSAKAIVLGGHMDTLRGSMPGADDDASGTSSVYELYHNVLRMKYKFNRPVYFIFYAAEEVGLVGSKYVVSYFQQQKIGVRAVMQLDMTGFDNGKSTGAVFFVRDHTNDSLTNFTKKLAVSYLGKSAGQIRDLKCGYACSDHARWSAKGIPAVFPFEAKFGDHNRDIHTSRDSISTVDPKHTEQFLLLAGSFLVELGEPAL